MAQYKLYAGLAGGFGGATYRETVEAESEEIAAEWAFDLACDEYESYAGLHGIPDIGDILDNPEDYGLEEGCSEDDAWEAYIHERETWLDYWAELIS